MKKYLPKALEQLKYFRATPARFTYLHVKNVLKRILPYLGGFVLLGIIDISGLPQTFNLLIYDFVINQKDLESGLEKQIAIISIEEEDLQRYGWPIDDSILCEGIDRLDKYGSKAIGLDIYRDQGVGKKKHCLNKRFRKNEKLVSIFNVANNISAIPGTPLNRQAYNDLSLDSDGVLRRDLLHVSNQDDATVSFPLRIYEIATGDKTLRAFFEKNSHQKYFLKKNSGGYRREKDAGLGIQRMLRFKEPNSFLNYSLTELLNDEIPPDKIMGKSVLIGSTAPSLKDLFEVPFSRFQSGEVLMTIPGVEIHAHRLATLFDLKKSNYDYGFLMPFRGNFILILILTSLSIVFGESFKNLKRSLFLNSLFLILTSGLITIFLFWNIWIGVTLPTVAILIFSGASWLRRGLVSQEHSQQIRRLLGQATSPAIAEQLWNQRDQLLKDGRFEGRKIWVTILFTDMADFTKVSEKLDPSKLMDWLNRGMSICVPAITKRGGMVNKFTGDGMLAVFGVPISNNYSSDANSAINAAYEIHKGLTNLNKSLLSEKKPEMRIRIGIHSGEILAGTMGSPERLEYALIGDTVNCASRLESLQKQKHTGNLRVLFSSSTRDLIDQNQNYREWGFVKVKGREKELNVFELILNEN